MKTICLHDEGNGEREGGEEMVGGFHKPQDWYFPSCHVLCSPQNLSHTPTYTHTQSYAAGVHGEVVPADGGGLLWWYVYQD